MSSDQSLPRRLAAYAAERFPLAGNGLLVALMCAGSIAPLGFIAPAPLWQACLSVFAVLPLFFIMRVADEHKDYADDLAYRPERPVPRGLVSLGELRAVAMIAGLIPLALALLVSRATLLPLVLAVFWIGAMSIEFGVKDWLRARPVVYLVSHMLVMPLLALVAISFAAPDAGALWSGHVAWVLALAFATGLVLEIGRKLWAPSEEREGVETYSGLWGVKTAAGLWLLAAAAALMLGALVSGHHAATLAAGLLVLAAIGVVTLRYAMQPDAVRAKHLRLAVVLTAATSYGLAIAGALIL